MIYGLDASTQANLKGALKGQLLPRDPNDDTVDGLLEWFGPERKCAIREGNAGSGGEGVALRLPRRYYWVMTAWQDPLGSRSGPSPHARTVSD